MANIQLLGLMLKRFTRRLSLKKVVCISSAMAAIAALLATYNSIQNSSTQKSTKPPISTNKKTIEHIHQKNIIKELIIKPFQAMDSFYVNDLDENTEGVCGGFILESKGTKMLFCRESIPKDILEKSLDLEYLCAYLFIVIQYYDEAIQILHGVIDGQFYINGIIDKRKKPHIKLDTENNMFDLEKTFFVIRGCSFGYAPEAIDTAFKQHRKSIKDKRNRRESSPSKLYQKPKQKLIKV